MTRWVMPVALGGLVALIALVATLALRPTADLTPGERGDALARELRCPDCQGLSVADSPTGAAREIHRQVDELVAGGATDEEVRAHFVDRYGEWILLAPTSLVTWLVPLGVLAGGVALYATWLAGRRRASPAPSVVLTPAERGRLHDEVDALDA